MEHKAFEFQWSRFSAEFLPILSRALDSGHTHEIALFIDLNLANCTDPYEGEQLGPDWRNMLSQRDVHELGDFALTKFYDVTRDVGIGSEWLELSESLPGAAAAALLGFPVGPSGNVFDPGRMGSYFQGPPTAKRSLELVAAFQTTEVLAPYRSLLRSAIKNDSGVYVTF